MKQSWDGWSWASGKYVSPIETAIHMIPVRVVPWGECPYPQEQVPQVGETVEWNGKAYIIKGLPCPSPDGERWYLKGKWDGCPDYSQIPVKDVLKLPAPTVEIGGKRYLESEVVERCKELEPVDA